jgi:hypothetical protein
LLGGERALLSGFSAAWGRIRGLRAALAVGLHPVRDRLLGHAEGIGDLFLAAAAVHRGGRTLARVFLGGRGQQAGIDELGTHAPNNDHSKL